jgi:Fe-S-cluster-containing dehydrogenase component/anaerobic selenocysteine-containing dehydrogenase
MSPGETKPRSGGANESSAALNANLAGTGEAEAERQLEPQSGVGRREFLRAGGALAATTALVASGCKPPMETSIPFNERPEGLRTLGKPKLYATVVDRSPVLVKTREGRPILIVPNNGVPISGGMTVRTQAALLDLYDPDRAPGPLSVRRGKGGTVKVGWHEAGEKVTAKLRAKSGKVALLTRPLTGPAERALVDELKASLGLRHLVYAPLAADPAGEAWRQLFGQSRAPRPRLDQADLIVGFGAEFLDDPVEGLEQDFSRRRDPDRSAAQGGMSRFIQLEGRLTLTGANADKRIRVRDSELTDVTWAVAHAIIVEQQSGPLAHDPEVLQALSSYTPPAVAKRCKHVSAAAIRSLARELLAKRGKALAMGGGSGSATQDGLALERAIWTINYSLGAVGSELFDQDNGPAQRGADLSGLVELLADIKAKRVDTLILAGPNPIYDAPASLKVEDALARLELFVSLNDRVDETSRLADYLLPASHPLEAWGDVELGQGVFTVAQPVISPLYNTFGLNDLLVSWAAAAGAGGKIAAAAQKGVPSDPAGTPAGRRKVRSAGYHYIRGHWEAAVLGAAGRWDDVLRKGFFKGTTATQPAATQPAATQPATQPAATQPAATQPAAAAPTFTWNKEVLPGRLKEPPSAPLELQLYPHFALFDGRAANNGWLLELPDPITRLTWGGALSIAPRRFDSMGLHNGDLVELEVSSQRLTVPAYRHAGMHDDQLALPLGLGRTLPGVIGKEVGVNAFALAQLHGVKGARLVRAGLPVTLKKVGGHEELALGQGGDILDRKARPLVPAAQLSDYSKNPRAGTEQTPGGASIWPDHKYPKQRWGMVIDLSKCTGCSKCVLGCQAENNIPVVGRKGIIDGREMSWLRIDRYYDAPKKEGGWDDSVWEGPLEVVEDPVTLFEPMLCQHCENAPCETVCPFNATMHSADGLNQQTYNRCVGTRYCANNCPFKVRRYNWFEYSKPQTASFFTLFYPLLKRHAALNTRGRMQMKNNPEVTVRSRGVMEKCSFCVQRIREARAEAIRGREDKEALPDGTIVPACMEACPAGAIAFGDVNDPRSAVSKLAKSPRAMKLLASIGVKPSVSYLTKVRNDNA